VADALPFRIALADDIPADAVEGHALRFTATEGLNIGDTTVIARGAPITGVIFEAGKRRLLVSGKMTFTLQQVESVDGQKLNVRTAPAPRAGGPPRRPVETPGGGRSKTVAASKGTEYVAYIDGTQLVSVRR